MGKFVGLCVGGPKAGQTVEYIAPYFRAPHSFTYAWVKGIVFKEGGGLDFWVHEGDDVRDAIETIVRGYVAHTKNNPETGE